MFRAKRTLDKQTWNTKQDLSTICEKLEICLFRQTTPTLSQSPTSQFGIISEINPFPVSKQILQTTGVEDRLVYTAPQLVLDPQETPKC